VIAALDLAPLPREGGFFRQTWRDATGRSSAIYFLVTEDGFSALHRLKTLHEIWHHHAGDGVEHVILDPTDGSVGITCLGGDVLRGDIPQLLVPAGVWQGARLAPRGALHSPARASASSASASHASVTTPASPSPRSHGWALLSCTVTPAWDDADFVLGDRAALAHAFPAATTHIYALTR